MKGFQLSGSSKRQKIVTDVTNNDMLEKDHIVSISNGDLRSTVAKSSATQLIIPLATVGSFDTKAKNIPNVTTEISLTSRAEQELIAELTGEQIITEELTIETNLSVSDRKRAPILTSNVVNGIKNEDDRFKHDLSGSADDMNFRSEIYDAIPVNQFGAALLRGMGWTGDDPKAVTAKDTEKLVPRENRLGLGAMAKPPDSKKHKKNDSSKVKSSDDWSRKVEARLRDQRLCDNDLVWLRDRRYGGRRGRITTARGVPGLDMIRVELETDGTVVEVSRKEAVLLTVDDLSARPYQQSIASPSDRMVPLTASGNSVTYFGDTTASSNIKKLSKDPEQSSSSSGDPLKKCVVTGRCDAPVAVGKKNSTKVSTPSIPIDWLRSGIRVKIVSSSSSAYKQKGTVLDVVARGLACVRLDRGDVLTDLKERHLETILPEVGGSCVVLLGEHKGEIAVLLEKRWNEDAALVELTDDLRVVSLPMDMVAAYS
jgi:G patch domain/KOW motif-containing protein